MNKMFKARLTGEAYALRGLFRYHLLQTIAGKSTSGKLLGIPLWNEFLQEGANFNMPRAEFKASVDSINADFDRAASYLPMDYPGCHHSGPDVAGLLDGQYDRLQPGIRGCEQPAHHETDCYGFQGACSLIGPRVRPSTRQTTKVFG